MEIQKAEENTYEIPKEGNMKVPVRIFASEKLLEAIKQDKTLQQAKNVSQLPGIQKYSIALSDAHQGYGFSIGGVAAFDLEEGIISPGGVGYDINCGVRLLKTNLNKKEFLEHRKEVLDALYENVPSGVGIGSELRLDDKEMDNMLKNGSQWAVKKGYGKKEDYLFTENEGRMEKANPDKISQRAKARGKKQLGTLGAGNHFLEVQFVDEIFDEKAAKVFGLKENQVVVLIHTGSRGFGHQTATDYIKKMEKEYGWDHLPDRQLICAPIKSELGKEYREAMEAAANFAFANRQVITHKVRKSFEKSFPNVKIDVIYDITHNMAKFETYKINGNEKELCVHRKGATRAFGPGNKEIPKKYQKIGQPVFIPGSMGTASYVLIGTKESKDISFSSTVHGAGRVMSRSQAKREVKEKSLKKELEERNVAFKAGSVKGMLEEAPDAYKDIEEVARVVDKIGISKKVARLRPLAVIKG